MSRAFAIRPDASGFALGTDYWMRAYDAKGKERWSRPVPGIAWGVDFSADGEILVVAYGDGTIRWLRWTDGEELLALFVEPQSRKWVAWTPTGYYMASAGGEDLIGWHVNRGWDQEADFFAASQFRAQYNRPDIVRLVLQTRDEAEAVRRRQRRLRAHGQGDPGRRRAAAGRLDPVARRRIAFFRRFDRDRLRAAFALRPADRPPRRARRRRAGRRRPDSKRPTAREAKGHVAVTLPRKDTKVSLIAYSGDLTSAPVSVTLTYDGPSASPERKSERGRSAEAEALRFARRRHRLHEPRLQQHPVSAARDAESLAEALKAQKGGLLRRRADQGRRRPDDLSPTPPHVIRLGRLYWLKHAATSRDLAIVFLSGHGIRDPKQNFWFLTREADIQRLRTTAVSNDDLLDFLARPSGEEGSVHRRLSLGRRDVGRQSRRRHDIRHEQSGQRLLDRRFGPRRLRRFDRDRSREGGRQMGQPRRVHQGADRGDRRGQGVDRGERPSGRITTAMLDLYLDERVKDMTDGAQHPVMNRPILVPDFPLALARR